jgi:glycosyltransferase involved in cell wall biosynthesis
LNILFLSEQFYPHGGGAELATYLYAKLLSKHDFKIIVITNRFEGEPGASTLDGFSVYRLPFFANAETMKYSVLSRIDVLFSTLMKKMMKWADVVYIPRFWFSAIPIAKFHHVPVVTHFHDYIPICALSNFYDVRQTSTCDKKNLRCSFGCIYAFEKAERKRFGSVLGSVLLNYAYEPCFSRVFTLSDALVCVSEAQMKLIAGVRTDLSSRMRVIYNPLPDTSLDAQGKDFGYFGGFNKMKGFHVLYNALAFLKRAMNLRVPVHATKFADIDRHLRERLGDVGIQAYEKLSVSEYLALRRRIGTVIVPSVWQEPLPYVVTEALLNQRLLIASHVGGIPEQVAGCKGAFLFDAGNHGQLAEKLLLVKDMDNETKVDLGTRNREFVLGKFNNDKTIADFSAILTNVRDESR